jgi:SAM-dependent methyltransferase
MLTRRSSCRLCSSSDVSMVFLMPKCPPVDNYRFEDEPGINLPEFPMDLYMCDACGHAQLLDVVDPSILFGSYIYDSSSSPDLDNHFANYAQSIVNYANLGNDSFVIDVGSNDGLLLSKFIKHGVRVLGIDASETISKQARANGIPTVTSFLDQTVVQEVKKQFGLANVVCANNVFSHSDDLRDFAICIRELLKPDGFFVFEVSYLKDLVNSKIIDYVYHEHLAHHSVKPLKSFFDDLGMRLFDVERVATKGGSIRGYVAHHNSSWRERDVVEQMVACEISMGLYDPSIFEDLRSKLDEIGERVRNLLQLKAENGGKIASYGASATTTVLTALFHLDKFISFIVDDNPKRQGRLSPGKKIPVKSSDELLAQMPSVTIIAAWRFADLIISRNRRYLESGGCFLVPLPVLRTITAEDLA